MPRNLIEIWDPLQTDCGEFHVIFTLEKTPAGIEKVKPRVWGGKCEGNPLSSDTLEAINLAYLSALRDAANEMKPSRNSTGDDERKRVHGVERAGGGRKVHGYGGTTAKTPDGQPGMGSDPEEQRM